MLDNHALKAKTQTKSWDLIFPGKFQGAQFALDAADSEAAGDANPIKVRKVLVGTIGRFTIVRLDPAKIHLCALGKASGSKGLCYRQVCIWQVNVLTHQTNRYLILWLMNCLKNWVPTRPVDILGLKSE